MRFGSLVTFGSLLVFASAANAQVPALIAYQGKLLNADGTPAAGVSTMVFTLYDAAVNGTALWTETQSVPLSEGFYAVLLGSVTPIPAAAFDGTLRYLDVSVGGASLSPRQTLASIPYAYRSQTVVGGPVSATQISVAGQSVVDATGQLVAGAGSAFAPRIHTHAASDIVSGTLAPAVGGTGLSGPTAAGQYLRASGAGKWTAALIQASDLPTLSSLYLPLAGGTLTGQLVTPATADANPAIAVGDDSTTGLNGPAAATLDLVVGGQTQASFGSTAATLTPSGTFSLQAAQNVSLSSEVGNLTVTAAQGNTTIQASAGNVALKAAQGNLTANSLTATLSATADVNVTAGATLKLDGVTVSMPSVASIPVGGTAVNISSGGILGVAPSARRYKWDIQDIGDRSDELFRLRPVAFRYRKEVDADQGQRYGLIAEEVDEVDPALVVRTAQGEIQTVRYDLVNALLLNSVQRQNRELTEQAAQIEALATRLTALEGAARATR